MIRLLKRLLAFRQSSVEIPRELHSLERMRAILDRERQRSDRGNTSLALLTLKFAKPCDQLDLDTLALVLQDRIRATDDAGLFGSRQAAVIMPETSAEGAWKLATDLGELLPADLRPVECAVYTHPNIENYLDDANGLAGSHGPGMHRPHRSSRPIHALFAEPLPLSKRLIDVVCAGSAMVLMSPLLLLTALAVKLSSPGPIIYAQQRDGHGGRRFWIYKFRTMCVNADSLKAQLRSQSEQDGPAFKLKNDPRVTRVGRILRRTCIDELPQLWNVLRGDMTIVGPRPMCSKEAAQCAPWERRRLDVTPGLTCIWQVYGGTKVTFAEWMRMDLRYARARSLWKDCWLVAMTVPSVIKRRGVY